jgi:hypothetical protein
VRRFVKRDGEENDEQLDREVDDFVCQAEGL